MQAMAEMPRYESHKKVWALKIKKVLKDDWGIGIQFEDPQFSNRVFTNDQLKNRPVPEEGMYLVQYEDGYISFSPGKQFEEGYTRVN
jgi:hypothetical protein